MYHVNRDWNIPDYIVAIINSALMSGMGQISIMPLLVLSAQICPKSVEGFFLNNINIYFLILM